MKRKSLTEINPLPRSDLDNNKNALIASLLKRILTYDLAIDYLLSAVEERIRDDILGELLVWDAHMREPKKSIDDT